MKKKYNKWIGDSKYSASTDDYYLGSTSSNDHSDQAWDNIPKQIRLNTRAAPGICFGYKSALGTGQYVGMPQGEEGNILIIGGNGSGKSAGIAKPTLYFWHGAICVTDIKGELSDFYKELYQQGLVKRPFKVFDPMQTDCPGYDPFYWLIQDEEYNLINNIRELALAIIPTPHDVREPFWIESEQSIFTAALLYCFKLGLNFSDSIRWITSSTVTELISKILETGDEIMKIILGDISNLKPEILADIDRGLRNKLLIFTIDPYISNAFRGIRAGADCFTWDNLNEFNIFLRIPADKIEQWSGVINLMYTQLIRHLERRHDKYSPQGENNVQTLLLMDEFARFGKMEIIANAMSTLRSKSVNICLVLQSLAQLDKLYGEYDRRIILDNCQYQAILRANDADTQECISRLIGTHISMQRGKSEILDDFGETTGYSNQSTEIREPIIFPHELSTLKDILLLTPYGFCCVDKIQLHNNLLDHPLFPKSIVLPATACIVTSPSKQKPLQHESDDDGRTVIHAKSTIAGKVNTKNSTGYCKVISVKVIEKIKN